MSNKLYHIIYGMLIMFCLVWNTLQEIKLNLVAGLAVQLEKNTDSLIECIKGLVDNVDRILRDFE